MIQPSLFVTLGLMGITLACQPMVHHPETPVQEPAQDRAPEANDLLPSSDPEPEAAPPDTSQPEEVQLPLAERLEPLLGLGKKSELSTQDLEGVLAAAQSSEAALRAYALLLLYREDPKVHWEPLAEVWGVNDYAARAQGEKQYLQAETFAQDLNQIEKDYAGPRGSVGPLLVGFLKYRDTNGWLAFEKGDVSVARFLRGAVMETALRQGAGLRTANRLDKAMRAKAHQPDPEREASNVESEAEVTSEDH